MAVLIPGELLPSASDACTGAVAAEQATLDQAEYIEWSVDAGLGGQYTLALPAISTAGGALELLVDGVGGRLLTFAGNGAYGLTIPSSHPRLWFDAERLARARAWYAATPFTPSTNAAVERLNLDRATRALLTSDPADAAAQAAAALDWAIGQAASSAAALTPPPVIAPGGERNNARYYLESMIAIYDWCHPYLVPPYRAAGVKETFVSNMNAIIRYWMTQTYGGVPMVLNNYFWGFLRNELLWGIASYEDNVTEAEDFLHDAFDVRLAAFHPVATTAIRGGALIEGGQYGPYPAAYSAMPFRTTRTLGRDVRRNETNYWREVVYAIIAMTTRLPTTTTGDATVTHRLFPNCDIQAREFWRAVPVWSANNYGDALTNLMTDVAGDFAGSPVGQHARAWLNMVGATPYTAKFVRATDAGGAPLALSTLPLDYYAPGIRWLYGRAGPADAATSFFWQMGDPEVVEPQNYVGHSHLDWGTFQLWRNGRFLTRETCGYISSSNHFVRGYHAAPTDAPSVDVGLAFSHNTVLVGGQGVGPSLFAADGSATVPRLESRDAYVFAVADLTPTLRNGAWSRWVREYLFLRGIETTVILDRLESVSPDAVKTFLLHSETAPVLAGNRATITVGSEALEATWLVPEGQVALRTVVEGGDVGQYRIEADTTPGTAQSYILTVLQAKSAAALALAPSVVDDGANLVVTLDLQNSVTFQKGMTSSGGSVVVAGAPTNLRADAQAMFVTDNGPTWGA